MSVRPRTFLYRVAAFAALVGAMIAGALLAVKSHGNAHAMRPRMLARGARTIAVPAPADSAHPGAPVPIATVIPADAGARTFPWPPALLNPGANLRMAWDLALGRPSSHEILFTFDDGPNPGTTERLLALLDRAHYHAVFFVCGWRLETEEPLRSRARALLREEFARGHAIGNHTVHHRDLATLTPEQVRYEIDHNAELIEEVLGQRPHLFRPPYGSYSADVQRRVIDRGDELMVWSIDSHDWQMVGDAQAVAMNVIRLIGNMAGGTVLLHDTHPWSVSAAQMVFRWLETENRDRAAHNRTPYRVVDPAEYMDGERARIPVLEAEREAVEREARHARRHAGDAGGAESGDGGAGTAPAAGAAGADPRMGSGAP